MATNLYDASYQWRDRPDDERFASLPEMLTATQAMAESARSHPIDLGAMRIGAAGDTDLQIQGQAGGAARVTHYAFGQLARLAGAPTEYVRTLPTDLAVRVLNHGLEHRAASRTALGRVLLHAHGGGFVARAVTSESYDRVWDAEVVGAAQSLARRHGWQVPPARPAHPGQRGTRPATEADLVACGHASLGIRIGDPIAPAGLYGSGHDCFIFMVRTGEAIDGGGYPVHRGIFLQNSEVGDCSLQITVFILDAVCGNHIVWGASDVQRVRARHVKATRAAHGTTLQRALAGYDQAMRALPSADTLSAKIAHARATVIAPTDAEVVDRVVTLARTKSLPLLTRARVEAAVEVAAQPENRRYGGAHTPWGVVNGLTEVSQSEAKNGAHTDIRAAIDAQAGRLMDLF